LRFLEKSFSDNGEDFLWLVLQHVLPKGFRRVRDYGFLHGNAKKLLIETAHSIRGVTLRNPKKDICIHKDPANFQRARPTTG
jgi:hypothetical protein